MKSPLVVGVVNREQGETVFVVKDYLDETLFSYLNTAGGSCQKSFVQRLR